MTEGTAARAKRFLRAIEALTGHPRPNSGIDDHILQSIVARDPFTIGYSQFNELLVYLGYDSICPEFFDLIAVQRIDSQARSAIVSLDELESGIEEFQRIALLAFGNIKFAFKQFGSDPEALRDWLDYLRPIEDKRYTHRRKPVFAIQDISQDQRFMLGYLTTGESEQTVAAVRRVGEANQRAYLTSDYLDVYVATSMRERHEFTAVAEVTKSIFAAVSDLRLRYFDPTLAFCGNHIDKGLAEALMLKRAKCTVYLVQETDTLGKDSELAVTLAQGKPVIAYVPPSTEAEVEKLVELLRVTYPSKPLSTLLLEQLRFFDKDAGEIWKSTPEGTKLRKWLNAPDAAPIADVKAYFSRAVCLHYDKRAETLRDKHPLGIQVNIASGVAVGVLVVRDLKKCAELVRRIMLGKWDNFKLTRITDKNTGVETHLALKDEISDSYYRVMTRDLFLANSFWNFYLRDPWVRLEIDAPDDGQ